MKMRFTTKCSFVFFCVLLILLYDTDNTSASGPPTCHLGCKESGGGLLKLEEGVTYTYNLDGNTETLIPKGKGPHGDSVKIGLKAKVEVSALPDCKAVIKLNNVQVTGPDAKKYGNLGKIEEFPLVVSLHAGKLDSEICADPNDDYTSLNIKRAVASLFQANTKEKGGTEEEVDVFGGCRTTFRVTKDAEFTVIKKRRDLNDCKYREGLRQDFFATSHGHFSKFQSTPLLGSDYQVEQKIKNGVLEIATARESYLFRPFANRDNGARTNVHTKLTLESAANHPAPAFANSQPRSIIFENPHEVVTSNAQAVIAALHKLDEEFQDGVPPQAGKDFGALVKLIRHTSKEDLLNIYGNAKSGAGYKRKDVIRKIYTDALFRARSAESIAVAVELLKNHEIEGNLSKLWYLSFAFVRHTSASALSAATTLLDEQDLPYEAFYGIGGMAGQYCREHACDKVPEFENLVSRLSKFVSNPSKGNKKKENQVIAALKGLKNVKHLTDEAANKVANMIKDVHVQTRVRVAALETAQTDACRGKLQRAASEVFTNREEDSELRIKAYLVMVECPTAKTATKISEFMETEPVNQVGTFVTSHLRNLRAGSNPDKELAREVFYNIKPKKKFPVDYRKFSHNYDFSYNLDAISTSAAVESNVIFSQRSYLPRSVSLNLTTEIFGHAFNLFELNGRAENLESIIEQYFGPKGYFKTHKPEELYKEGKYHVQNLMNHIQDKYKSMVRHRRSVSRDQTDHFASKVKLFNSEFDNTIDVDLSLKVLGNELWWLNLDERHEPEAPSTVFDKLAAMFDREINKVKEFRHEVKEHFQILDSELSYPTATGLPLRLRAVGSGVFHMKLGGKFDLAAFIKDPKHGDARLEMIPSASVNIHGEMTVDAYAVEAGVRVTADLHSSTGTDITVKLLDGHGFDLNVRLPVKNSDVLTATTEVLSIVKERGHAEVDQPLEVQVPRSDYSGCFDQLNQFVGIIFCGDVGFPLDKEPLISNAALFPLNGHSKVSLRFIKQDESLESYQLRVYFNIDDPHSKSLEVKFDTPGSQSPREISFRASVATEPNKALNIELISPVHRFHIKGEMIDTDTEHSLSGSFMMNDAMEYKARVGLLIDGPTYKPVLEYTRVGNTALNVKVDGTVNVDKRSGTSYRSYRFNNVMFIVENKGTYSIDGTVTIDSHLLGSDLRIGYDSHTVGVRTNFERVGKDNYKINAEITPSQHPNLAFSLKYDYQRDEHHLENNLVFIHGPDLNSADRKLSVFQQVHFQFESFKNFDISTKNSISYPAMHLDGHLEGAITRKSLSYNLALGYERHRVKSKLNAKTGISQVGDYEIDFFISAYNRDLSLQAKREIVDTNKSKFHNILEISPGRKYEVIANVIHQLSPNDVHFAADAVARIHNLPNEYRADIDIKSDPSSFKGHTIILVGPDEVINGELHFTKTAEPSGNFKLMLAKVLDTHGEYQMAQGKGTGSFVLSVAELQRKVKGTADLTHNGPHHTGVIEIFYDFERDPSKKLHIQTDTQLTRSAINTKNNIQLNDKHFQINFNGDAHGKLTNGAANAAYEVNLPDGQRFAGRFKEALHLVPQATQAELFVEMGKSEKQGAPLSKIFLDAFAKNVDIRSYGGQFKFVAGSECPEGSILYSNTLDSVPHDGKLVIDHDSSVSGSLIKHPYTSKTHALLSKTEIKYDTTATFGEYSVKGNAKILTGIEDGVRHLEYDADIRTNLDNAQNIRLHHLFVFTPGHRETPNMITMKQHIVVDNKSYELEAVGQLNPKRGFLKGHLLLPGYAKPSTAQFDYNHEFAHGKYRSDATFTGSFDQDKTASLKIISEYEKHMEFFVFHVTGHVPVENLNNIDIKIDHKKVSAQSRHTDMSFLINDEKMEGYVKYDFTPQHPLIDVSFMEKAGKSRFYYKLDKTSERQATSEGLIAWTKNGGGQLDFISKMDLESFDNFHILTKINSEALKIDNIKLEVVNKPSKSGAAKKINVTIQKGDKTNFAASVSYKVKENESGFIVEGKGNVEIDNEKHPVTYKAIYRRLNTAADREVGTSFVLNSNYNKGTFTLEHKLSDKEFHYNTKFCKESNCFHFEALSKMELTDILELNRDSSISYVNNMNGRNDNYKLFSTTKRKGLVFDHETGLVHNERRYHIKSYVHEEEGAVVITLPSREILAIANYEIPILSKPRSDYKNGLQIRFDGSLYMDKTRNPGEKANLLVYGEFATAPKSINALGQIKFSHPRLNKDLQIKTKGALGLERRLVDASAEFDVFNDQNHKIAASLTLDHDRIQNGHNVTGAMEFVSRGLYLDLGASGHAFGCKDGFSAGLFGFYTDKQNVRKEAGAFIEGNKARFFSLVKLPNKELLKIDSKLQMDRNTQVIDTDISLAEKSFYTAKFDFQGWNTVKTFIHPKDNPGKRIEGNIVIKPSELMIKADNFEAGNPQELLLVNFKLGSGGSSQPSFAYNSEHIQHLVEKMKAEKNELIDVLKPFFKGALAELEHDLKESVNSFKKATPDYQPLLQSYQAEFEAISNELNEDPEFKMVSQVLQKFVQGFMNVLRVLSDKFVTLNEKMSSQFNELNDKLKETYNKIAPSLNEAFKRIFDSWLQIANELLNHAHKLITYGLGVMKEAEPEVRKVVESLSVYFKDLWRAVFDLTESLRHETEEWFGHMVQGIKELPIYSTIEEQLKELANFELPQQFWTFYDEMVFAVEDILPTIELKNLVKSIFSYVEKKLKSVEVNDAAAFRGIFDEFMSALKSVLGDLREQYLAARPSAVGFNFALPFSFIGFNLPEIGSLKDASFVRYVKAISELPSLSELFYAYRPTLNPLDYIPPYNAYATIVRSHHFFTFDKRHLAFEGTCSYILAQDFVDGNFSVVGNFENGKLKSIVINDRTDTVEMFSDNTVSVNGKHGDYPFEVNDMSGWMRYGAINFKHKAGVKIRKIIKQDMYNIKVSGFYFWRTRGILGTINNEEYDEFILPDGHIAHDASDFINAYRVVDSCQPAAELKPSGAPTQECDKFFATSSTFKIGFNFLRPEPYREACDQHVHMSHGDKLQAACDVVAAYVVALKKADYLFASLPPECAKCDIAEGKVDYGHSVPIKSPTGKADVVFVVEQSSHNAPVFDELVKPLMNSLKNDLAASGLADVEYAVIGFGGPKQSAPRLFANDGKMTFHGKSENMHFGDTEKLRPPYDTFEKKIRYILHYLSVEFGKEPIVTAMYDANIYPFRQGAAKIIILVNSSPCEKSATYPLSLQIPRTLLVTNFYKEHGLNFHLVSPLSTLTVKNNPNDRLINIVGFDNENVYTVDGTKPERKDLVHFNDLCIGFSQYYGGAAFSSQNFIESSPENKHKFIDVISKRVAKGAVEYDYNEECTCNLYHGLFSYPECKVTSQIKK